MADHRIPPPPAPPPPQRTPPKAPNEMKWKSYEERKAAEDAVRAETNRSTKQSYRIRTQSNNNLRRPALLGAEESRRPALPDTGGVPTRDMTPIKLPLAQKQDNDQFADVIPLNREKLSTRKQEDSK